MTKSQAALRKAKRPTGERGRRSPASTPVRSAFSAPKFVALSAASVAMLSLASAPFGQWYLAWFALAPWLIAVGRCQTMLSAMAGSWLAGIAFFALNVWWLWPASIAGTVVLIVYLGSFWAAAAGLIRGLGLLSPALGAATASNSSALRGSASGPILNATWRVFGIAMVWVLVEYLWCDMLLYFPWIPLGTTQAPLVTMCQVADLGGPWIVSAWAALPSALLAVRWLERTAERNWRALYVAVATTIAVVALYGVWRLQTTATTPGPRVMLLQSNFPHLPGGARTVDREQIVEFFLTELPKALAAQPAELVVLPESEFPPLNDETRRELAKSPTGPIVERAYQQLLAIARAHRTTLVVGGDAVTGWRTRGKEHFGSELRNSAYFFDPDAAIPVQRYDKIHLVPFSERPAIVKGPDWVRWLAGLVSARRTSQPLHAGSWQEFRPFELNWPRASAAAGGAASPGATAGTKKAGDEFIAPICLENIEPTTIARMVRGPAASTKQVDFIANLSNDGWFAWQEKHQHLQTTIFRCIENRVPMARCSNTGISAFIDSVGRVQAAVAPGTAGFAVRKIELDGRYTFYTRHGDVFAIGCVTLVAAAAAIRAIYWCFRR